LLINMFTFDTEEAPNLCGRACRTPASQPGRLRSILLTVLVAGLAAGCSGRVSSTASSTASCPLGSRVPHAAKDSPVRPVNSHFVTDSTGVSFEPGHYSVVLASHVDPVAFMREYHIQSLMVSDSTEVKVPGFVGVIPDSLIGVVRGDCRVREMIPDYYALSPA
jgi:hypothetical protein